MYITSSHIEGVFGISFEMGLHSTGNVVYKFLSVLLPRIYLVFVSFRAVIAEFHLISEHQQSRLNI